MKLLENPKSGMEIGAARCRLYWSSRRCAATEFTSKPVCRSREGEAEVDQFFASMNSGSFTTSLSIPVTSYKSHFYPAAPVCLDSGMKCRK